MVWGTKQVGRRKCCDIENADFFAAEQGVTKGGYTSHEDSRSVGVYEGTVYGTPYQADGVEDLTYGTGATQQSTAEDASVTTDG